MKEFCLPYTPAISSLRFLINSSTNLYFWNAMARNNKIYSPSEASIPRFIDLPGLNLPFGL